MPRKNLGRESQRKKERREREKKIPFLVLLTCKDTSVSKVYEEIGDRAMIKYSYKFPLNGDMDEFERIAKNNASCLYVHFKHKIRLSEKERDSWRFKIRTIKASNLEMKIFYNDKSEGIIPPQAMGKIINEGEINKMFAL